MNGMITYTKGQFKSPALNKATEKIATIAIKAQANRKELAITLWAVEKDKLYKEDGMKSIQEYASKIGLDKSLAHKLADAGKLYTSDVPEIKEFASNMDYSKAAILASVDTNSLKDSIASGEVKSDATQQMVREFANRKNAKDPKGTKVLKSYDVTVRIFTHKEGVQVYHLSNTPIETIDVLNGYRLVKAILPEGYDSSWTGYMIGYPASIDTDSLAEVLYTKPAKPKVSVKSAKNMSKSEIEALIREYQGLLEIAKE